MHAKFIIFKTVLSPNDFLQKQTKKQTERSKYVSLKWCTNKFSLGPFINELQKGHKGSERS